MPADYFVLPPASPPLPTSTPHFPTYAHTRHGWTGLRAPDPKESHARLLLPRPAGIPPTHRRAHWTAAALFQLTPEGQIHTFIKEWDKLAMWQQLGWVQGGEPRLA